MKKKYFYCILSLAFFMSCSLSSKTTPNQSNDSEILVDLTENTSPSILEDTFKKYNLKTEKVVSPQLNIVLFSFNEKRIDLEELIEKVKKEAIVEEAQSNKKIIKRR